MDIAVIFSSIRTEQEINKRKKIEINTVDGKTFETSLENINHFEDNIFFEDGAYVTHIDSNAITSIIFKK